ncbi:MAG: hypothetical protein QM725_12745 [Lacibacter sp.]
MANNEVNIKKIDERNWKLIKSKWLAYIPDITTPGEAPSYELKKFYGLQDLYSKTANNKMPYFEEVASLRSAILWEGLYLTHKSLHVIGSAILHLDNGITSWSLTNAYQSSFFAVKAIISILGLSFPQLSKPFMIDCFPKGEELTRSQLKKGRLPKTELKFAIFNDLSHVEHWEILQRILYVSSIGCWDEEVIEYLKNLSPEKFVEERNKLHYINNYWTVPNDLFVPRVNSSFAENQDFTSDYDNLMNKCGIQHPFFLNYTLIRMVLALIKDLAELSNIINDEYSLMLKTIRNGMHARFLNSIDATIL